MSESERKIIVEDYHNHWITIYVGDEQIYNARPDTMAIINALADYFEHDVEWEMKEVPDNMERKDPEEIYEENQQKGGKEEGGENPGDNPVKVAINYENEIDDGSVDYENDLNEEDIT